MLEKPRIRNETKKYRLNKKIARNKSKRRRE